MTLAEYQTLTGITVPAADQARVTAQIARTQTILEDMLGYTLDPAHVEDNHYTEIGKTSLTCPCPDVDMENLEDADAVEGAYRVFNYNRKDKIVMIDPASAIHAVKLVKIDGDDDGLTFKTFESGDYRAHKKHGFFKFIEECEDCCFCSCQYDCYCTQLAVDADWLYPDDLPTDLLQLWADMIGFYSDPKKDIQSERLGSHSYTKFYDGSKAQPTSAPRPEFMSHNQALIQKYVGANGSARRILTV